MGCTLAGPNEALMTALPRWPDSLLARYEPLDVLQTGDPDYLYLAEDRARTRRAFVLLFRRQQLEDWRLALLRSHSRLVESVRHPRLLLPFEWGEVEELVYLVFPDPGGKQLEAFWSRAQPMDPQVAVPLLRCLLEALEFLHARGIAHGCVDPERVYRCGEGWALLDATSERALGSGTPTEGYLSPAHVLGQALDPRDDLYQLGLLAYLVLTGEHPFERLTRAEAARACLDPLPDPPVKRRPFLPQSLSDWVVGLLQPRREDRPRDAEEALARLEVVEGSADMLPQPSFTRDEERPAAGRRPQEDDAPTLPGRPALPPVIPYYESRFQARWWQVALVVLAANLGAMMLFRGLGGRIPQAPRLEPLPPLGEMKVRLDASATLVQGAGRLPPLPSILALAPGPGPAGPPPAVPQHPFSGSFPVRVESEFEAAQAWTVNEAGEVLRGEESSTGSAAFLDPDPLQGGRILEGLTEVAAFRTFAQTLGQPETLPFETREALRDLDERFRRQGLPRPFHPYVYLGPARTKLAPDEAWRRVLGREPPPGELPRWTSGWFVTATREAAAAVEALQALEARSRQDAVEDPWVRAVHGLRTPEGRLELARLTEAGRLRWRRAVYASARSLREEPATRELLALLMDEVLQRTRALAALDLLYSRPEVLLLGAGDPAAALLGARLQRLRREDRELAGIEDPDARDRERALWRAAAVREGWGPLELRRQQVATLEELQVLREAEDLAGARDFWAEVQPRLASFEEQIQARLLAGLFELMVQSRSRLYLDDEAFERAVRRAEYLAPLLDRRNREGLTRDIAAAKGL